MPSETNDYKPLMKRLVRLLGLFFFIDGLVGLTGNGIDLIHNWRIANEYGEPFYAWTQLAWTIASAVEMLAGLGLLFKTQVALDAIYYEDIKQEPRPPADNDAAS